MHAEIANFQERNKDRERCTFNQNTGVDQGLESLASLPPDEKMSAILAKAQKDRGLILEIVRNEWTRADDEDGVKCSIYRYSIFFKDRTSLFLDYEMTD